jgi:hypothetical protein
MLEHLTFTGRELLVFVILAVVFATVVYLLETLLFSRRRQPAATPRLDARIEALQDELAALKARVENLEARPPVESALDTQAVTYAEAMRLAREGASAQELAGQLGISRSEAELIIALQRSDS